MKLSVIIPAHNEEGHLSTTVQSLQKTFQQENIEYEIVIINDNSVDNTASIAQKLKDEDHRIVLTDNTGQKGFGRAIATGLEIFTGDAVCITMADGSDMPYNVVDYFHKIKEGYDCVFGSRFIKGAKIIDYPSHKLILNRISNCFVRFLFGLKYNDITNAFKCYRRETIEGLKPVISYHFNLTVELPLKAIVRGYSYTVIPTDWKNRTYGKSKWKIKEMGSRYMFIVFYILLEKYLSRGDYLRKTGQSST